VAVSEINPYPSPPLTPDRNVYGVGEEDERKGKGYGEKEENENEIGVEGRENDKDKSPPPTPAPRFSESIRGELIFRNPYEWSYTTYLFELMREAQGEGVEVEGYWKEVEGWRKERRDDTGLRKRVLGF
jgi:hypothetical protein